MNNNHYQNTSYRPDIDGLRAIAVLSVIGFHAFPQHIRSGFIGVDIFFVISGFLISSIIFNSYNNHQQFQFLDFYKRRMKRILPALLIVLASCFVFGWFALFADEFEQLGKHIASAALFFSNFTLWGESGYFDNTSYTKPLLHLWSLGVEEQFYLFWPLALWGAWKCNIKFLTLTICILIVSFCLNIHNIRIDSIGTFYAPQTRIWELLTGTMLACLLMNRNKTFIPCWIATQPITKKLSTLLKNNSHIASHVLSFIGFTILTIAFLTITQQKHFPGWLAILPTLASAIIIASGQNAFLNRAFLSNKLFVWIGLISFPLYLWHWPLLSYTYIIYGEMPPYPIRIVMVALSFALAWLTYIIIERPIRFGMPHNSQSIIILPTLLLTMGSVGYFTFLNHGIQFRSAEMNYANNKNELIRTPPTDDECLNYINDKKPLLNYCRFTNTGSNQTVAVIGDSHAHVAYPGIAELLAQRGINTLLLANSGCPSFIGAEYGETQLSKNECRNKIKQIMKVLLEHKDIHKVFILSRGPCYTTGKYYGEEEQGQLKGPLIAPSVFFSSLQKTIDTLRKANKEVYYVTENPELLRSPIACISRPFRNKPNTCTPLLAEVKLRQEQYLKSIEALKNVIVINTIDKFCPQNTCKLFDRKSLLYADGNHLSIAGSRYQAKTLLRPYLI